MSWLDDFLLAIRRVRNSAGEDQPYRAALQFGPGFTLTDDPATNAIIVGGGGGGGGATGPTGPTGPAGATGATGANGVASQLPSGWAELLGNVGFSPGPTLILQTQVTTETTANVWAAVSISWQTTLASSGAAFFVTLSNGINTYTSDETWSDATAADDDVAVSLNFRTPAPVAAGTWTARVYGRRTKSMSSLVCTHCDLTVLGMQGAIGPTGATGPAGATGATGPAGDITSGDVALSGSIATVVGIQGRPVFDATPTLGQALVWTADDEWAPGTVGGGITSGDVTVTAGAATVVGLQGQAVAVDVPTTGQILTWSPDGYWAPRANAATEWTGDISIDGSTATVVGLQGQPIGATAPMDGALLAWDGSQWVPSDIFDSMSDVTYVPGPSPEVIVSRIQHVGISDTAPSSGEVLAYNGTQWAPTSIGGDVILTAGAATVVGLQNANVSATAPTTGQMLRFDGTEWAPFEPVTMVFSASINMKVVGNTLLGTTRSDRGRFIVTEVWSHIDDVVSPGVTPPSINVGYVAGTGYYEFVSGQSLPNSSIVDNYYSQVTLRAAGTTRLSAAPSTGIYCRVATASNATTYTATIVVRGYYLTNP